MIQNILKTWYLCKSHLANDSNCNPKFGYNMSVIPITGLYNSCVSIITVLAVLGKVGHKEKSSPLRWWAVPGREFKECLDNTLSHMV